MEPSRNEVAELAGRAEASGNHALHDGLLVVLGDMGGSPGAGEHARTGSARFVDGGVWALVTTGSCREAYERGLNRGRP